MRSLSSGLVALALLAAPRASAQQEPKALAEGETLPSPAAGQRKPEEASASEATSPPTQRSSSTSTSAPNPEEPALTPPKIREHFAPINDQPGGLTAEQAGRAASTVSPDAEAAQAKVDSANASVNQVTWKYLPRLTLSASYTRLSNQPTVQNALGSLVVTDQTTAGPIGPGSQLIAAPATQAFQQVQDQWYLNAELLVPLSDYVFNVKQAVGGARSAQEAARLTERAERVTASANAKIAYYDWVGAKLAARETDKSVERARKQYETLKAQQAAGRAARADVLRADAFLSATELDQVRARTQESIARERLNVLMTGGVETNQPQYAIGEDILNPPVVRTADQKSISELQQEAITYRMELRALRKTQEALDQKAKVDRSMAYPRVEGFGNLTYANPNPRVIPQVDQWFATWNVGVRATFTVNDVGINRAEVKKTQADIAELTAQRKGIEYGLRTEVLSAYQVEKEARLAVGTAARGLDAAEAAYRDRVLLYENGRATSLDLLEAESALVGARLDLVQTYVALKKARVRLDHALGRDAREIYPEDQE